MAGARFNLVRADDYLDNVESLDHESGSSVYHAYDEVELVTPNGEPAAMANPPQWINQDIRYEYVSGAVGFSEKRRRHQVSLVVDYLDNATRAKLDRWARDRALVWFNPGHGRFTDIAYRALEGAGSNYADGSTTMKDLTGRWSLSTTGDNANGYVWDHDLQVMRGLWTTANPRRVVPTPFGAAQVCERSKTNVHSPGYPQSASEGHGSGGIPTGDSGWQKDGAGSGTISFAFDADGFGHDMMPGALRVHTSQASNQTRSIYAHGQWDSGDGEYISNPFSAAGEASVTVSIWLKGRFSGAAALNLYLPSGESDAIQLDDYDLSEWTKLSLQVFDDWTGAYPYLTINLATGATPDNDDFWIGPMTVLIDEQVSHPEWSPYNTATTADATSASSYTFPPSGSAMTSFYVPDMPQSSFDVAQETTFWPIHHSETAGRLGIYRNSSAVRAYWYRAASYTLAGDVTINPGEVNTLCAVWTSGWDYRLYCNGVLVDSAATSERAIDVEDTSGTLTFGGSSSGPFWFMTGRVDRRAWTADEVAQMHASLSDPVAALISAQARGRKYRIVSIPSTPRNQSNGTAWIGQLVLEEYEHDTNLADITTGESY